MTSNVRNLGLSSNIVFHSKLFSKEVEYYCQTLSIPEVRLDGQDITTMSGILALGGEVAKFGSVTLGILVDENLKTWREFFRLINEYNKISTNTGEPVIADSWVEIYDSKNKYLFRIIFKNSIIDSIGQLDYTANENNNLVLNVTLKFDYMEIAGETDI